MFGNDTLKKTKKKMNAIYDQLVVSSFNIFEKNQAIIFMAPETDVGNTTSVIASAYYLSHSFSAKTVIIDGNPVAPQLDSIFGVSSGPGFFDVLADDAVSYEKAVYSTDMSFDVVPAGSDISNKRHNGHQRFEGFFDFLKTKYDSILFDACPISCSHYFMRHLKCFNGVILVLACERTRWEVARHLQEKIAEVNGNTIGVILNKRRHYIPEWMYQHLF